jgi:hypothetical protein
MQDFMEYKVCNAIGAQEKLISLFAATKLNFAMLAFL